MSEKGIIKLLVTPEFLGFVGGAFKVIKSDLPSSATIKSYYCDYDRGLFVIEYEDESFPVTDTPEEIEILFERLNDKQDKTSAI